MEKAEITRNQIRIWFNSNRQGDKAKEPCFWALYPMKSAGQTPVKNSAKLCENFSISDIDDSVEHLVDCMSSAPTIKYFAIRLKTESSDTGYATSYANPYYKSPMAGIGGLGSQSNTMQQNDLVMAFVGMMREGNEQRVQAREESMQKMLLDMEARRKREMAELRKDLKHEREVKRLKEENKALRNTEKTFIGEVLAEIKPELSELAKAYIASKGGLTIVDNAQQIEGAEQASDSEPKERNKEYLEYGLKNIEQIESLSSNPELFFYKVGLVLNSIPPEQRNHILNTIETTFTEIQKGKQNG